MNSIRQIVVIGAGGHAKVVIEAIRAAAIGEIVGLIDPQAASTIVLGVPVIGGDAHLPAIRADGVADAVVGIGNNAVRERIAEDLMKLGFTLPSVVHPAAYLSPTAQIEAGAVIMARAVIGVETSISALAIINTGAVVDHDNLIGRAAHVAPGCSLAGNVIIGARTLIGVGSSVRPGITIGSDCVVGAGSAVVTPVSNGVMVGGAPARSLNRRKD